MKKLFIAFTVILIAVCSVISVSAVEDTTEEVTEPITEIVIEIATEEITEVYTEEVIELATEETTEDIIEKLVNILEYQYSIMLIILVLLVVLEQVSHHLVEFLRLEHEVLQLCRHLVL